MDPSDPRLEQHLDAASALIGLDIAEAHRPGVLRFLSIAAEMAAKVATAPLDDAELALAPVYAPPDLPEREPEP